MVPKWSQNRSQDTLLHNTCNLHFSCYLQHFGALGPPKTIQKVLQNRIKNSTTFGTSKSHPIRSKKVSKRVRRYRGRCPLGHLWCPYRQKGLKKGPQRVPKEPQRVPKGSQKRPKRVSFWTLPDDSPWILNDKHRI